MEKQNLPMSVSAEKDALSEEQRARISLRFRAAKALLARKKPRVSGPLFSPSPSEKDAPSVAGAAEPVFSMDRNHRIPLGNIDSNRDSPFIFRAPRCSIVGLNKVMSLEGSPMGRFDENAKRVGSLLEGESFHTPVRPIIKESRCSNIGSFHTPSVTGAAEPVFSVDRNHRISIGNINSNRDSPFIFRAPRCSNVGLNKVMSSEGSPMGRFVKNGKHVGSLLEGESFHTPAHPIIKESECSSMLQHSLFPSLPDEDFDDGILQQIDIVCKEKTAEKVQGKINSSSMQVGSFYKSDEDLKNHECVLLDTTCSKSNNLQMILNKSGEDLEKHDCMLPNTPGSESNNEQMILNKDIKDMPEEYTKYVGSLNDQQQEAACSDISVPLMVVAGPGSGKTSTMVGRVLMLLSKGIGPSHILAMTFTTAAASEMRDRVSGVTGKEIAKELNISTFHSFSLQFCRSHAEKLGYTSDFLIYGHGQQRRAVIEALRLLEMEQNNKTSDDAFSPQILKDKSKKWQKFVTQAKASGVTPEDFHLKGDEIGATLLKHYNDTLRTCNALDYHDLINYSVKLLNDHPKVLEECHQSWKAVIVDEFQDTSAMQYRLLRFLASHGCLTVVGDEDQSIFSFNGADISGFDSFRKDFPRNKEIRLKRNYRSTRCIVEAASALIRHNKNRCQFKNALTENASGDKISVKECQTEDAQCSFVIDKILEYTSEHSATKLSFNKIAILYRRQVSGKVFQTAFRSRRIPFNEHGVAFYRKKVIKAIMSMLKTALSGCDDASFRQVFKALLPFEKEEKNKVIEHINKVATVQNCSFISAAREIFSAKISGTFKRSQLSQGRKVLATLEMISKLVQREESISAVITSVGNLLPQRYLLEKRAVVDAEDGKLLNEDNDLRSVLQYLLDDVNDFLSTKFLPREIEKDDLMPKKGCTHVLKAFIDYISERERENFRSRRHDNDNSVTLTTIHQSKGLEWDIVFIVKVNESEIPLLHEHNGIAKEKGNSLEEERRLLYVAMTRARKKLFLLYLIMDSNWQMLQPSRFLREIPDQLYEMQERITYVRAPGVIKNEVMHVQSKCHGDKLMENFPFDGQMVEVHKVIEDEGHEAQLIEDEAPNGNCFLQRFDSEDRGIVSRLFHQWARKKAFQDPKRLIDKVRFVVDERLRQKQNKSKDALHALKSCLGTDEAIQFAGYVLRCEQIDPDTRAHIMREKQQHFQKLRMETVMNSSEPTSKQIAYLRNLGCTIVPDSRLHASHLIEQYKSL